MRSFLFGIRDFVARFSIALLVAYIVLLALFIFNMNKWHNRGVDTSFNSSQSDLSITLPLKSISSSASKEDRYFSCESLKETEISRQEANNYFKSKNIKIIIFDKSMKTPCPQFFKSWSYIADSYNFESEYTNGYIQKSIEVIPGQDISKPNFTFLRSGKFYIDGLMTSLDNSANVYLTTPSDQKQIADFKETLEGNVHKFEPVFTYDVKRGDSISLNFDRPQEKTYFLTYWYAFDPIYDDVNTMEFFSKIFADETTEIFRVN